MQKEKKEFSQKIYSAFSTTETIFALHAWTDNINCKFAHEIKYTLIRIKTVLSVIEI